MNAVIERAHVRATSHSWLDQYYLLRVLKDGGMARVYLAYDTATHQQVAIKRTQRGRFDEALFVREVQMMRGLHHPHILPVLDARSSGQWNYIVLPYIAGGTLQDRIDQQTLTFEEMSSIIEQLSSAMHYMHSCGIIHRDIKPNNILLDGNTVYLADFGIATWQREEGKRLEGPIMGTPAYMAAEMYEGQVSRQSDLYALGTVVYQMVTGSLPFEDGQSKKTYWKQKTQRPLAPSLLNPYLSLALEQVILRALEREPQNRFQTAAAFAQAYQKAVAPSLFERLTSTITNTVRTISPYRYHAASRV